MKKIPGRPHYTRQSAAVVGLAVLAVLAAGLASDVSLGDENHHVGFARAMAETGSRVTHNPLFPSAEPPGYPYVTDVLWPALLALIWRAGGSTATWIAQLYQALWLLLLLVGIWYTSLTLFDRRAALMAVLTALSVPMFTAFSVLLYTDMPGAALLTASAAAGALGWGLPAGLLLGLGYLTKKSILFMALLPAALVVRSVWCRGGHKNNDVRTPDRRRPIRFVVQASLFAAGALAVVLPNYAWERAHLHTAATPVDPDYMSKRIRTFWSTEYLPSHLNSPLDQLKYLGPVLLVGTAWYLLARRGRREDLWLWGPTLCALAATLALFSLNTDIRYLMPLVPAVCVVLGRALSTVKSGPVVAGLVGLCLLTPLATAGYMAVRRQIPPPRMRAFANLRETVPPGSVVVHPEEAFMLHAHRGIAWSHLTDPDTGRRVGVAPLFDPDASAADLERLIRHNGVDFILVKTDRVVQTEGKPSNLGAFPSSFVGRLPRLDWLERLDGDWPGYELWQVKPEAPSGGPPSGRDGLTGLPETVNQVIGRHGVMEPGGVGGAGGW